MLSQPPGGLLRGQYENPIGGSALVSHPMQISVPLSLSVFPQAMFMLGFHD